MNHPDISRYEDPLLYLKNHFQYLQTIDSTLTLRRWATRMAISPVLLASLFRGKKRLRIKDIDSITKGLDLSASEVRYLQALVLWQRATSDCEKQLFTRLLDSLRGDLSRDSMESKTPTTYESEDPDLFSHWMDAAVMSAMRLKSVSKDLSNVRENFLWENDLNQVDRSLAKLQRLGFLEKTSAGGFQPKYDNIATRSDKFHRGARIYFAQMNKIATDAVELPFEKREFQCFSIPVCESDVHEFKEMLREFRAKVSAKADELGDTVYQFNFEMFPLTTPVVSRSANPLS
jgi:uncharacterized protein (TIGR02147 family)